jgi:hypothetical protein
VLFFSRSPSSSEKTKHTQRGGEKGRDEKNAKNQPSRESTFTLAATLVSDIFVSTVFFFSFKLNANVMYNNVPYKVIVSRNVVTNNLSFFLYESLSFLFLSRLA